MQNQTPQAVQSAHELLIWLIPQLDKFPRARRFTLGERLEAGVLVILERLIEAAYTPDKEKALQQANLRLDIVRHLWRAAQELQLLSTRCYEHGARLFDDLGKQIGGWLKSHPAEVMKRLGGIWSQVVSFENLLSAYRKARRGKRERPQVARFGLDLEREPL